LLNAGGEKPVGRSWRYDETYIKVGGRWVYLCRAVDERGRTVASHLSRRRDVAAVNAFFRKALKRHRQSHTITWMVSSRAFCAARHGDAQRVQLSREQSRQNPVLSIPEQYRGAGLSTDKVTHSAHARIQKF